jgi:hypothetical protein
MFIDLVFKEKRSDECLLILVTPGGSPDAAFKIARYLQSKYEKFSVLVSGLCKSAGTLLSVGAYELIFMPYGELGPLDVQMVKTDNLAGMESGLNIGEAFMALELRTRETYSKIIAEIIQSSGGVVSFQTAAHAASEVVSAMYGPIFSRIDPEEVGSRSRAMRIGEDYCKRLNAKWSNLKPDKLSTLSQTYSSHGFVIDRHEAAELFQRVRDANDCERAIVSDLGNVARHPSSSKLTIKKIPIVVSSTEEKADDVHPVSGTEKGTRNLKPKRAYAGGNSKKPSKLERIEAKSSAE